MARQSCSVLLVAVAQKYKIPIGCLREYLPTSSRNSLYKATTQVMALLQHPELIYQFSRAGPNVLCGSWG